jgi:hypothetical protein
MQEDYISAMKLKNWGQISPLSLIVVPVKQHLGCCLLLPLFLKLFAATALAKFLGPHGLCGIAAGRDFAAACHLYMSEARGLVEGAVAPDKACLPYGLLSAQA